MAALSTAAVGAQREVVSAPEEPEVSTAEDVPSADPYGEEYKQSLLEQQEEVLRRERRPKRPSKLRNNSNSRQLQKNSKKLLGRT